MSAEVLDGKRIAAEIRTELAAEVRRLSALGVIPGLGVALVGDDPASHSYVTAKEQACRDLGMHSDDNRLPAATTQAQLMELVERLNRDPRIHGILVQLPLPRHIDEAAVLMAIRPEKDVDGFHPVSVGRMVIGAETYWPCTPHGVLQMLARSGVRTEGAHVVVVGRSNIVGKPVANLLLQKAKNANATVTVCHTGTRDIGHFTRQADILIVAAGRPRMITADIDVGVNRIPDPTKKSGFRLVGDVDFEAVREKASKITPVPGGVGPMTITMLMYNTVESARRALARGER